MSRFLNPYHFVPLPDGPDSSWFSIEDLRAVHGQPDAGATSSSASAVRHDRSVQGTLSGRIVCRLTTESHCVVGARRNESQQGQPSRVEPFTWQGEAAIPHTTLRGLIGSIAEAASGSAMRVLNNAAMSRRASMRRSRTAIAMVWGRGEEKPTRLLPLTFPHLDSMGSSDRFAIPTELRAIADVLSLPFYVDGYQVHGGSGHLLTPAPGSFLANHRDPSFSSSNDDQFWVLRWAARNGEPCHAVDGNALVFDAAHPCVERAKPATGRRRLLAQQLKSGTFSLDGPFGERQLADQVCEKGDSLIGVLRRLSAPAADVGFNVPKGKYRELFIPLSAQHIEWDADGNFGKLAPYDDVLLDASAAIRRFEAMADALWKDSEGQRPLVLRGQQIAAAKFRLRHGDLVHLNYGPSDKSGPDALPSVESISISSIWREDCGQLFEYLKTAARSELRPFHLRRSTVSPAEAIFGWASDDLQSDDDVERAKRTVVSMAGRVRFSIGRVAPALCGTAATSRAIEAHLSDERVLPLLGSPKPPCPEMYFRKADGGAGKIQRNEMTSGGSDAIVPMGRKVYWHHARDPWDQFDRPGPRLDRAHMRSSARALRPGCTFLFHIDFRNLSASELALLCYALRPTDEFRHLLGMGKPVGLGRVRIDPLAISHVDAVRRYADDALFGAPASQRVELVSEDAATCLAGTAYESLLREAKSRRGEDASSIEFCGLRSGFRDRMNSGVRHALELIGNPSSAGNLPIHYPMTRAQPSDPRGAGEHFKWFVANQDGSQHLKPVGEGTTANDLSLNRL